jgi:mono/diheme cytochrome c family protein
MDFQPKYQPERESSFFADGRSMRPLEEGVVPTKYDPKDDDFEARETNPQYFTGRIGTQYVGRIPPPVVVDQRLMDRGQARFNIYCAPCHDQSGSGNGLVFQHGYGVRPTDLSTVPQLSDGELFTVVTNGAGAMPSYRKQIPVEDRWAIIAWVRVLQRSQRTTVADVPADMKNQIAQATVGVCNDLHK